MSDEFDVSAPADYLDAIADTTDGSVAAAELMDRLAERLNAAERTADRYREINNAAEALAELASDSRRPTAVIEAAENSATKVSERARIKKAQITDRIADASQEVRRQAAQSGLSLENGYALDQYLEEDLTTVKKVLSTDSHTDPTLRWEFSDGVAVETTEGRPFEWYGFWKQLAEATDKKLLPEFVSEKAGDPSEDGYGKVSLGPESRPWSEEHYIEAITDLVDERAEKVESVGSRTHVWEAVGNHIGRSRAVSDLDAAVENVAIYAHQDGDELLEVWIPSRIVTRECEEFGVEPKALQQEVAARGADSDELAGDRISEPQVVGSRTVRFWRLDTSHPEVPEPDEIVDQLTTPTDGLDSVEWGDLDE